MKFIRIVKASNLKMTKSRGGETVGPLPTIHYFTDNCDANNVELYWDDKTRSENIARKHVQIILSKWLNYTDEEVKYIMNNFLTIEKTLFGEGPKTWRTDDWYTIQIKGSAKELPSKNYNQTKVI